MKIGGFDFVRGVRPDGTLTGVKKMQTEFGPADVFADMKAQRGYMRVWLNRDGLDEIVWFELQGNDKERST